MKKYIWIAVILIVVGQQIEIWSLDSRLTKVSSDLAYVTDQTAQALNHHSDALNEHSEAIEDINRSLRILAGLPVAKEPRAAKETP